MKSTKASLLPIFRSGHQLKILAHIFVNAGRSFSISQLAAATGASEPTVSREVDRLLNVGLVTATAVGRTKLVEANRDSPYFTHLHGLLLLAAGPADLLREGLSRVAGVEMAYVFGSWARRYHGEIGEAPRDIDVVIIGAPDPEKIDSICLSAERKLGLEVNPVILAPKEWQSDKAGFVRQLKKNPLVPLVGDA